MDVVVRASVISSPLVDLAPAHAPPAMQLSASLVDQEIIEELLRRGAIRDGDLVIITKGDLTGVTGGTNVMKILRVGEHILPD